MHNFLSLSNFCQAFGQKKSRITAVLIGFLIIAYLLVPDFSIASFSQGYASTDKLVPGTLVSFDPARPNSVKPSTLEQPDYLLGVVVGPDSALLSLSGSTGEVQVATNGLASALVTNLNGDIKIGDKITISPIEGVGMKALQSSRVVGVAQGTFTGSNPNSTTREVKDKSGKTKTVSIGQIPVEVEVTYFATGNGDERTLLPSYVQDLVDAIAGKKVSMLRIGLAAGLLLFALITVGVLIYGSVHSSIISIGRNPLSQSSVFKSLISVILITTIILLVTLAAVYLIISR